MSSNPFVDIIWLVGWSIGGNSKWLRAFAFRVFVVSLCVRKDNFRLCDFAARKFYASI